ncbi:MAG: glycine zipper domain-containing protein [Phycisphaerales bacterium]|nr:glycine zipper domain-containing protein [Phycisphaerales bacterium]MCI0631579.1 glycine zipper domain-containing protein [Phycisphaerales bacterium]MCI0676730.1 glycine zipper domain-containing protein [Phycisphaerales bacterium]
MHIRTHTASLSIALAALISLSAAPLTGCEDLPGTRTQQATVIGGASGAVLGAVLAKENRLLGALIGGLLGAGGGYLIGANTDWFGKDDDETRNEVQKAVDRAERNPATPEQARRARTADINNDGFVTLDEVVAMERAGFSDDEMIQRLEATNQIFDLNQSQEDVLRDNGVSGRVITRMKQINRQERDRLLSGTSNDVISRDSDD